MDPLHSDGIAAEGETSTSFNISFQDEVIPGTYPLVFKITYHDANMYQFSTVACRLVKTFDAPSSKIRGSIENLEITTEDSGTTSLKIWNDADEPLDLKIKFNSPNELKASLDQMNISIDPLEEKQIPIDVESFGALVGSSYVVFASIEYESDYHYTSFAEGKVGIVETNKNEGGLDSSNNAVWLIFVLVFLVTLFIGYQIWESGREK